MTDNESNIQNCYDVIPVRRGVQLLCRESVPDCPVLAMNNWNVFKYDIRSLPNTKVLSLQIIAPDVMDSQITHHMYGFVLNLCRACLEKRKQNAL